MRNVYAIILVAFILTVSGSMLTPIESLYLKEIAGDYSVVGYILGLSSLAFIISSPITGSLSDIFGRRNVILVLLSIGPFLRILMGIVRNVILAAILRFISGIIATFGAIFLAYVGDVLENVPRKNFFYSLYIMAIYLGYSIGSLIAGIYTKELGAYFPVYLLSSIFFAISAVFMYFFIREEKGKEKRIERARINFPIIIVILLASLLNLYWGLEGYLWPIIIEKIAKKEAAFYTSVVFSLTGIIPAIILPIAGRWGDKVGSWPLLFLGWLIMGITSLSMPVITWNLPLFAIFTVYFEVGAAVRGPAANTLIIENTTKKTRGFVFGIISSITTIFYSLGSFLTGFLLRFFDISIILLLYGSLIYSSFIASLILYLNLLKNKL